MIYKALLRLYPTPIREQFSEECWPCIRVPVNEPDQPDPLRCFDFRFARLAEFYSTLPERSGSLLLKEAQ